MPVFVVLAAIGAAAAPLPPAPPSIIAIGVEADAKLVEGEAIPPDSVERDRVVFFDAASGSLRRIGAVHVPVSFQGPPASIAFTPDRRLAFVPAANGRDSAVPQRLGPLDIVSVVRLDGDTPRLVQTLHLGAAATAAAVSPDGTILIVTHADDDSASIIRISDEQAELMRRVWFDKGSRPLAAVFLPDGRSLAITFAGSNSVSLFRWRNMGIDAKPFRRISAGIYPASFAICGDTGLAVVGNYGTASGDADTISLIDLDARVPVVIDTVSVGPSPEGVDCSPDGRYIVAANQNMSTVARSDPRHSPHSEVVLLAIRNRKLAVVDRAEIGAWAQGATFLGDGMIAAESIADHRLHLFGYEGGQLVRKEPMTFDHGGPAILGRAADIRRKMQ